MNKFIDRELRHFRRLPYESKLLLASFAIYNIAHPLLAVFNHAFLWRELSDIRLVAFYSLIFFAAFPFGFRINNFLLKRFNMGKVYAYSFLAQALSSALLFFIPIHSLAPLIFIAFTSGTINGTYWANRTLLTLLATSEKTRAYFHSIEAAMFVTLSVSVPAFFGWFLDRSKIKQIYGTEFSYQALCFFIIILVGIGALLISKGRFRTSRPTKNNPLDSSKEWKRLCNFALLAGFATGYLYFFPALVIMNFVGAEFDLGVVQSIAAFCSFLIAFNIRKFQGEGHRIRLLSVSVALILASGIALLQSPNSTGAEIFVFLSAIALPLFWNAFAQINYRVIERINPLENLHPHYLTEREFWIETGRMIGILIFIILNVLFPIELVIQWCTFGYSTALLVAVLVAAPLVNKNIAAPKKDWSLPI